MYNRVRGLRPRPRFCLRTARGVTTSAILATRPAKKYDRNPVIVREIYDINSTALYDRNSVRNNDVKSAPNTYCGADQRYKLQGLLADSLS